MAAFPTQQMGLRYLAEGGQETELMYRHGFDLPEFAMFPLLDDPRAVEALTAMYRSFVEVAVRHQLGVLVGGLDYRASPDWASRLRYSPERLADAQLRAIEFLHDVADPYAADLPALLYAGIVGPRGDAYSLNATITADEAAEYHAVQVATLARAGVDLVEAMTFNNVPEAVGVALAAAQSGLPASVSFTLDSTSRLQSGPTLKEAIERVDDLTGADRPDFYGINCSHPYEFMPALDEPGSWVERIRSLRPNAAMADKIALCTLGHLEVGDPALLGQLSGSLARRYPHIDIWGGCCGTWDVHLDEIAANLASTELR